MDELNTEIEAIKMTKEQLKKQIEIADAKLEEIKLRKKLQKREKEIRLEELEEKKLQEKLQEKLKLKERREKCGDETIFECLIEDGNNFVTNQELREKFHRFCSKDLKRWIKERYENVREHTYMGKRGLKGIRIIENDITMGK